MTLESTLPYLSVAAALAAGVAAGRAPSGLERALKTTALAALALFAYFRWIAPSTVAVALVLSAIGQALLPRGAGRWRRPATSLIVAAWLVFAWLFFRTGDGWQALFRDGVRGAFLAAALIGAGVGLRRLWPAIPRPRLGQAAEAVALMLMAGGVLTLDWGFWPAMAGALGVIAAEALALAAAYWIRLGDGPTVRRAVWALSYLGQTAMAYAFLK